MGTTAAPRLLSLISKSGNEFGSSFLVLLAWLMKIDGEVAAEERALLNEIVQNTPLRQMEQALLAVAEELESVELACDILRRNLQDEEKDRFIELFVGMLVADGYISSPEVFAIGFISDLFGISPDALNGIMHSYVKRSLPPPSDPGSLFWWAKKEQRRKQRSTSPNSGGLRRIRALATLGLEEGATMADIKLAYRRLTKIHHPDRFTTLGEEAIRVANSTFARINDAYEYLTKR